MVAEIVYRQATVPDIPLLALHHRLMFEEMRAQDDGGSTQTCCAPNVPQQLKRIQRLPDFARLESAQREKLGQQIIEGSCTAWIAEYQGKPIGSGALSILRTTPIPEDPSCEVAFLHSVYTDTAWRGQGIASTILDQLIEQARRGGLHRIQLNASEAGRSVYQKKGFQPLEEAMLLWV